MAGQGNTNYGNGLVQDPVVPIPANGNHNAPADNAPPHNIDRNPNDPPRALENAATEVCDPEQIRENAVGLGVTAQAVSDEEFTKHVDNVYLGMTAVRVGAITAPATAAAGEQNEIVETTKSDIDEILADRAADDGKAARLEGDATVRAEMKVLAAGEKVEQNRKRVMVITDDLIDARQHPDALPYRKPELAERVALSPHHVAAIALFDIIANAVFLEPAIGKLVITSVPFASFLIAAALSTIVLVGSATAGFSLAMVRLPSRAVGVLGCAAFAMIFAKFIGGLDMLREVNEAGLKALTAATMVAAFVALLTSYAITVRKAWLTELAALVGDGTKVGILTEFLSKAERTLAEAEADEAAAIAERDALLDQIEELHDSAARADAATSARESTGIAADVKAETIQQVADIQVDQEVGANMVWAVAIAWLARLKTRAEKLPTPEEAAAIFSAEASGTKPATDMVARLAVAVLAAGTLLGIFLGAIPVAAGAVLALLLLVFALALPVLGGWMGDGKQTAPMPPEPPVVQPATDGDSPYYLYQPDHMVPKYRSGDTGPGERN